MASDSDDEDELLQMALKEQAQRDLNYQRPRSSTNRKPVANFVQPPKATTAAAAVTRPVASTQPQKPPVQSQTMKNRRAVEDDDDDSEVEMLSISSGDEEMRSDRGVRGRKAGGGERGFKDDDPGWSGEEPDCWKRVDETELARRVREMRETRTAPVAQKFEQKPSALGTKGLSNLQSFSRGMEYIDPLGLGIIDSKNLRLITDSSSSPSESDRDHLNNNLRGRILYFSEKFDAKLFLSRIHQDTSAADLEEGALSLKNDLRGKTQQRKQLVKDNFDCFVSCKTTIDDIESKLRQIEEDSEGSGTTRLFDCMQKVTSLANRAFEPLFERQAQAEKIRSVQGMLQRFRTLFNLPSTIRGSISKGEYDLAVREYKKAKSIALPSHVNILKRVLEEVENVMREFKGMLYKSMEDPRVDLTSLEDTVRLLLQLEPESDPVWHYLNVQNNRIRGLLEKCTLDHEDRMESLHKETREKAHSDSKWRQIQQSLEQTSDNNSIITESMALPLELMGEEVDSLRGKYIRRLTAVLMHHLPAFWKIAQSVFSGKTFAKVSSDTNANASLVRKDERIGAHSLDEVAMMIRSTIAAYELKVNNTFGDFEESNILRPYMTNAIGEISKACQAFEVKDSAPLAAVVALRTLLAEISKIYIMRLCSWMRTTTEDLSKDETWVPVSILERNKSPYTISFSPLSFRAVIATAMDQITLIIQSLSIEAQKSEDMFAHVQEIQESVRLAFLNCFLDFAGHLEHIGGALGQNKLNNEDLQLENGYSHEKEERLSSSLPGSAVDPHQQLLMVLSNIGYCKDELSYELYNKYRSIWLQSSERVEEDSDIRDLVTSFSCLEEKMLAQYTFAKANLIRTAAMNYLLNTGVQWGSAPAVKGVRDAAVELLHTLVSVHSQVFTGAKPLLEKTLNNLVECLIDIFLSLFNENKSRDLRSLDANGFCQLMLELEYFEVILNPYFTPDARESLRSLKGVLLEKAAEHVSDIVENPGHQRKATRGSEDALSDDRQQGMTISPDDLIALAQQISSEFLQAELERTRINSACFGELLPLESVSESPNATFSFRGSSMDSPSRNFRSTQAMGSPSFTRQRRR